MDKSLATNQYEQLSSKLYALALHCRGRYIEVDCDMLEEAARIFERLGSRVPFPDLRPATPEEISALQPEVRIID